MKSTQHVLVFVTAPDLKTARKLAKAALEARLVACANLLPKLESHYWWHGKVESSTEILILYKTKAANLARLEKLIVSNHPYDTPEFVFVQLSGGNDRYLAWINESLQGGNLA